tara:strand:- start:393 stop:1571 length:1179 start_codon:yes stop_codon:yes gene_type:complete
MKKLMQLLEMEQGSLELKKGTSDSEIKKYTAKGIDVQLVDPSTENLEENESPYEYSKIDSAALGQKVLRTLVATLKAQGDEIHKTPEGKPDVKLTAGVNRFSIEVDYGDNVLAKNDTFKFNIDPQAGKLMFKLGNKNLPLINIDVTDGNNDSLNDMLLKKNLSLVLKKLKSEPNVTIPGDEPVIEPQQLDTQIAEKQLTKPEVKKREEIVKAMKKQGAPKSSKTYAIATAQAKKVAEELDPVGKEDDDINNDGQVNSSDKYLAKRRQAVSKNIEEDLDLGHEDDEPGMLKGDVYRIAKNAAELYIALQSFEGHGEVDFPHWWQAKIIRAADDLQCAKEYLEFETKEPAIDAAINTLGEAKGTCCHKCGHVHVKGTSHPTPYLTGQKNCKFRD